MFVLGWFFELWREFAAFGILSFTILTAAIHLNLKK